MLGPSKRFAAVLGLALAIAFAGPAVAQTQRLAPAIAAPVQTDAEFTRAATAAVERAEREQGFSGAFLVARGDKVLLRTATGLADREQNILNAPETRFPLKSIGKQFTATAIMLLVDDGKLSLEDPVSKHYPAAPPAWKDITIKHLLTHSSGMYDPFVMPPYRFRSNEDTVWFAARYPLDFKPGTGFHYSNAGYALLAAVIERVSGKSYDEFLRTRIFTPLGMSNSGVGDIVSDSAKGYLRLVTPSQPQGDWRTTSPLGVTQPPVYSTLDDMLRWSRAWDEDKILSPSSRTAMFTNYGHNYGFGWYLETRFGRQMIFHAGASPGFYNEFHRFPDEEVTVIVLTNYQDLTNGPTAWTFANEIERIYFGMDPYPAAQPSGRETPVDVSGTWQLSVRYENSGNGSQQCVFQQASRRLSGSCMGRNSIGTATGVVSGRRVEFQWTYRPTAGQPGTASFIGTLDAENQMSGTIEVLGTSGTFSATRQ